MYFFGLPSQRRGRTISIKHWPGDLQREYVDFQENDLVLVGQVPCLQLRDNQPDRKRSQTDRSKVSLIGREVNLIGSEFNPTRPAIRNESLKNASNVKGLQLRDKAIEASRFLLVHRFHCIDVIYLPHHIPRHPCAIRP